MEGSISRVPCFFQRPNFTDLRCKFIFVVADVIDGSLPMLLVGAFVVATQLVAKGTKEAVAVALDVTHTQSNSSNLPVDGEKEICELMLSEAEWI